MDKLRPNDQRVQHRSTVLCGKQYHYLVGMPKLCPAKGTILLLHGFPDLAFGWRFQVPFLTARGWRVVAPDMVGYGRTDNPAGLSDFTFQSVAADMAALVRELCAPGEIVVVGGHDWGGAAAWRVAHWYPDLVTAVFSICTPFIAPRREWISTDELVRAVPTLAYQRQFGSGELERQVVSLAQVRAFLAVLFTPAGATSLRQVFDPRRGLAVDQLTAAADAVPPPGMSRVELDFYAAEWTRRGLAGPLKWYQARRLNHDDEAAWAAAPPPTFALPALFIAARDDPVLRPELAAGMGAHFVRLTKVEVATGHWAMWEDPAGCNRLLGEWLDAEVLQL